MVGGVLEPGGLSIIRICQLDPITTGRDIILTGFDSDQIALLQRFSSYWVLATLVDVLENESAFIDLPGF